VTCDRLERDGDDLLGHLGEDMPHVDECPDCRARLDGYERLAGLLAGESTRPLPEGWKERTRARIQQRASRRRRSFALVPAGAVAATMATLLLWPDPDPKLAVSVVPGPVQYRDAEEEPSSASQPLKAHKGDILKASSPRADAAHVELRVYRESREVMVRCPGDGAPTCKVGDVIELSWPLPSVGSYQVLWLASPSPLPPPSGGLDADMRAAREAGAVVDEGKPVDVN
jgi:hypothetical protein